MDILLAHFRHQKYTSFQRQLNLYGFRKIMSGPNLGSYAHERFLRDRPEVLHFVRRISPGQKKSTAAVSPKSRAKSLPALACKPPCAPAPWAAAAAAASDAASDAATCSSPNSYDSDADAAWSRPFSPLQWGGCSEGAFDDAFALDERSDGLDGDDPPYGKTEVETVWKDFFADFLVTYK